MCCKKSRHAETETHAYRNRLPHKVLREAVSVCFRPNCIGLILLAAGCAFLISAAVCSVWLLLLFGAACVCGGVLCIRQ